MKTTREKRKKTQENEWKTRRKSK